MEPLERPRTAQFLSPRLVMGLFLILAGTLLVLDRLGILSADPLWDFWPVILIVIGLLKLVGPASGNRGGGVVLLGVGSWFLLRNFTSLELRFWDIFPFVVVLIGVSLVVGALGRPRAPRSGAPDGGSTVEATAVLGAVARANNSLGFRGGYATAIAGACELDLRQATIAGEAVIEVFAMWGGIEILVPETWTVDLRGTALLGSFEDLTRPLAGGSTQRLVVRGLTLMGGVEVKNHKRDR
jgi:predicted membrane protein